ncbi:hypothetical protein AX769_14850 [Frondihabitans sp. PAMC 28766]|uniref:hypothetical protein n=1 Tax=Frondihabitans sp. PAMC 28766 TaxID=1795630 RepID=UPI00078C2604|nr:hypothetical protein [Frondihabitans sp. PAMC 28766]AMM21178.1 hypothetical protein AX769_14850 [Frondihabitans sp. PAMC 28766]
MPTTTHDEKATARDAEVAALHPDVARHHVRATFPARIVLRAVEKQETGEKKLPVVGDSYLTVVVAGGSILFYADEDPVWLAASIPTAQVVGVGSATEPVIEAQPFVPLLRLSISEPGTEPLDLDLELFEFDGVALHRQTDIADAQAQWRALLAA